MRPDQGIDHGEYAGVDYGFGLTNIDTETGIRYGILHQNHVVQMWADESEPDYGTVACVECGEELKDDEPCHEHGHTSDDFYDMAEARHWTIDTDELKAMSDEMGDIFILKSIYFTYAQFCSPCAPGACSLANPISPSESYSNRCYCFGHDCFEEGKAPYRVWSIETGEEVFPA